MLCVGDPEDEVNHFLSTALYLRDSLGCCGMQAAHRGRCAILWKYTRAICECIANWRSEFPQYLSKSFLELFIDYNVLVDAKVLSWQILETRNAQVWIVFPIVGIQCS